MAVNRTPSTVAGGGLLVAAVLVLASASAERWGPTDAVVAALGNDYLLVAVVAAFALACLLVVVAARAVVGVTEATPPPVEAVAPETPERLDRSLESLPPVRATDEHRRIRERLRRAAVRAVVDSTRCARTAAQERVDDGSWTSDANAAAFLAGESLDPPSTARRVRARLRGEHWFRNRVRAAVGALESVREEGT